jgi:hypothetical protein
VHAALAASNHPPAHALKQAPPVVQCCGIGWLDLQCPAVVRNSLLKLAQPIMAECAVVVGPAVPRVEPNGLRVVPDGCLEATLVDASSSRQSLMFWRLHKLHHMDALSAQIIYTTAAGQACCMP